MPFVLFLCLSMSWWLAAKWLLEMLTFLDVRFFDYVTELW